MYYIVESEKSFEQAATDLEAAVAKHSFGVLHVHNLGNTLRSKGMEFSQDCKVFEICNPKHASKVLAIDLRLNMALPCRISVYTENGKTKIGMILPAEMLAALSKEPALLQIAKEVEDATKAMINEAK